MMKEFKKVPKNSKLAQLLRKKWFLPAVFISIAGIILSAVVWYQTFGNTWFDDTENNDEIEQIQDEFAGDFTNEEAQSVLQQQETIRMPVSDSLEAEIVTKFYDYDAPRDEQEKSLTYYNNRYYQSTGIDIAQANGEPFDVLASLSGTVVEVKEDPLLGNVVTLSHGDSITTHYASLDEVVVEEGQKVKQGDKIGTAGKNIFNEASGVHLHFEIHKDGVEVNPEKFFNEPVSKLEEYNVEAAESEDDDKTSDEEETEGDESEEKREVSFHITA